MGKTHSYAVDVTWVGNTGTGTDEYTSYSRDHDITAHKLHRILGSADASFRGDASRWNPEETLVGSVAACHKLWYLHLCCDAGIVVQSYSDNATAQMSENADGSGQFDWVHLNPNVTISSGDTQLAHDLHNRVGDLCFIARSVNFEIRHTATIQKV